MESEEYALMLMRDKKLSVTEIMNLSGLSKNVHLEDIPGIIHAISVLKNADSRFLERSVKEIYDGRNIR